MEIEKTVVPLNILATELDLSVGKSLVVVKVGKGELVNTPLKAIGGDLSTLGFGDDSAAAILLTENRRGNEFVPLLFQEGINLLLL
jgi:hypothetical protein